MQDHHFALREVVNMRDTDQLITSFLSSSIIAAAGQEKKKGGGQSAAADWKVRMCMPKCNYGALRSILNFCLTSGVEESPRSHSINFYH